MSIPTQVAGNRAGFAPIPQEDSDGLWYFDFAGIKIFVGTGSPDGTVTGDKGSIFIDIDTPNLWQCAAAGTAWSAVADLNEAGVENILNYAGTPDGAVTCTFKGQLCIDTTNAALYIAEAGSGTGWALVTTTT